METVTVLIEDEEHEPEGTVRDDALWVDQSLIEEMGWHLEDRGLCRDDQCIPIPDDGTMIDDKYINLDAFVEKVQRPYAAEVDPAVASVGPARESLRETLSGGEAPDFELPDRHGNTVRLSDFEGNKIFLLVWASW
jgi:hypothetical protein